MISIRLTLSQHLVYPDANAFVLQLSFPFIINDNARMEDYQRISPCASTCGLRLKWLRLNLTNIYTKSQNNQRWRKSGFCDALDIFFYSLNLITRDTNKDVAGKYGYSNQPLHNIINKRHARDHL